MHQKRNYLGRASYAYLSKQMTRGHRNESETDWAPETPENTIESSQVYESKLILYVGLKSAR